ncbi:MAG: TSUP family transporter [Deltaproteobacteria bacterium]|nr:TSUP family transporter [Deltaproteobacteria bacterium]
MEPQHLAALVGVAALAGAIDAVAGGGGLLTVPALMMTGIPMAQVLGTNKGQSVFGAGAALVGFWRAGRIEPRRVPALFGGAALGALGGAALVGLVPRDGLRPVALVLLVAAALFVTFRPRVRADPAAVARPLVRLCAVALAIGAWDGFFGPGTGTLLIVALVGLLGDDLTRASAHAKVANFASNLATLAWFAAADGVLWQVALPMAAGQALGGAVGARMTLRGGDLLVRRAVLAVVVALVAKIAWDVAG